MSAPYEQYTTELHKRFGYLATWVPNAKLQLGDVGKLRRDLFERTASLEELGIAFRTRSSGLPATLSYSSSGSVDFGASVAGNTTGLGSLVGKASAGLSVSFRRANAVLFVASDCTVESVESLDALGRNILARYQQGEWDKNRIIITEVITAGATTVLISSSSGARAEFTADATVAPQGLKLADLSGRVSLANASGIDTSIVSEANLTPLFKAYGVLTPFAREPIFEKRAFKANDVQFGEIDYE